MPYLAWWRHRWCSKIKAVPRQSFVIHPNGGWWQSTSDIDLAQPLEHRFEHPDPTITKILSNRYPHAHIETNSGVAGKAPGESSRVLSDCMAHQGNPPCTVACRLAFLLPHPVLPCRWYFFYIAVVSAAFSPFTWRTCSGGRTREHCTNVFSTLCCSHGTYGNAKCCSPPSCTDILAAVPTVRTCSQLSQSRCCPLSTLGMVGNSCCNGAEYSYTSSSSSRSSSSSSASYSIYLWSRRSSYSSILSSLSSVLSRRSSARSYSSWMSYTSSISSSLKAVLETAHAAQKGYVINCTYTLTSPMLDLPKTFSGFCRH
jgi:hypothetical protein